MSENDIVLELKNISKTFPGVKALDKVGLTTRKGEVHILLGENGAGKSTLMKIISGVYQKDEGEIYFFGEKVEINGVKQAQQLGISIIHQELNLLPYRTIAQNIFLGREPEKNLLINEKKMVKESKKLLKSLGLDMDPGYLIKDLSIAQQQMVEVVNALSNETKLLIMDEPTSSLTQKEIDNLFDIITELKNSGVSIIYISHRMEEIFRIGDKVSVMRDGKYVGTVKVEETDMNELITMMVGRKIEKLYNRTYNSFDKEALRTNNLTGKRFRNVNIKVKSGEIVGLAGLVGAGRTEVVKAIFGYDPIENGDVYFFGEKVKKLSPENWVKKGMGFLPEDRKGEGLILESSIKSNIIQASLKKLFKTVFIDLKLEKKLAEKYKEELKIATPDVERKVQSLSGGNQQKVVLAKWLCTQCKVFIFDEPTRGIDVGAKQEIYTLMNELAKNGAAIIVVSSDQLEVIGISDRIYVMRDGEVVVELSREEANQEKIISYAIGKEA